MKSSPPSVSSRDADEHPAMKYRAPALEKGLDILELISRAAQPLTASMITQELGRSTGELFRMILVLEHRGYIEQKEDGSGYVPTSKLFTLGMEQAPTKTLLESALPVMRVLSDNAEQSCHLATRAGGEIVIVARMEAAGLLGFSVRIGYRQPLQVTGSGTVLYSFQPQSIRERWEGELVPQLVGPELARFRRRADKVLRQGFDQHPSDVVPGIIDLSAPILRGDSAVAALTMPFVNKNPLKVPLAEAIELVRSAAVEISSELASNDFRV
jgi:DNA-binding IclR family transcriptional regulator